MLAALSKAKYFTTLDLKSGYWQISLNEGDISNIFKKNFDSPRQHDLQLKLSKCSFMQKETQYLCFIISEDGIMADPDKVKVMRQMLPPTYVREIRSFIGMCSYYMRFVTIFSAMVKPLIRLTKKFAKFE